jgi:hypothetical protein
MVQIRKAERRKAKLRLALAGPSGSGKTYSALQMAYGLGAKVGFIDTENGSGDLYATTGDYDIITLTPPYTVPSYLNAIKAFEDAGYTTIIIDSLSHAWAGEGGLLDKQGKIADSSKSGNSYTAWRTITPEHNSLIETILRSPCHIIATMRTKQDYIQEKDSNGKTVVRRVGLAPVMREGVEYEFTAVMDIGFDHTATASKDRTGLFDGLFFKITPDTGKKLLNWLDQGIDPSVEAVKAADDIIKTIDADNYDELKQKSRDIWKLLPKEKQTQLNAAINSAVLNTTQGVNHA